MQQLAQKLWLHPRGSKMSVLAPRTIRACKINSLHLTWENYIYTYLHSIDLVCSYWHHLTLKVNCLLQAKFYYIIFQPLKLLSPKLYQNSYESRHQCNWKSFRAPIHFRSAADWTQTFKMYHVASTDNRAQVRCSAAPTATPAAAIPPAYFCYLCNNHKNVFLYTVTILFILAAGKIYSQFHEQSHFNLLYINNTY